MPGFGQTGGGIHGHALCDARWHQARSQRSRPDAGRQARGVGADAARFGFSIIRKPIPSKPGQVGFHRFATGMHEALGLAWHDGALYATQRSEVTRLRDTDGDDVADEYLTVAKGWGVSGNYHEYAYGPVFDPRGTMWITLNATLGAHVKMPGQRATEFPWRGWAMTMHAGRQTGAALRRVAVAQRHRLERGGRRLLHRPAGKLVWHQSAAASAQGRVLRPRRLAQGHAPPGVARQGSRKAAAGDHGGRGGEAYSRLRVAGACGFPM